MSIENDVRLSGNCCADPEQKFTQGGTAVTSVRLATTRKFKKDGEARAETQFHNVKFFGKLAEIAHEYLRKGIAITVTGSIRYTESEKDGHKRYYTDIIADQMKMHGSPSGERTERQDHAPRREARQAPAKSEAFDDDFEDIPFD